MFKMLGNILTTVARVALVSAKVGISCGISFVAGVAGSKSQGSSMNGLVSHHWHSTLRPKGYIRPHEIGAEEVAQAQNEIRMQPVDMSQVQTQGKSMEAQPRVSVSHGVSNTPTMHI